MTEQITLEQRRGKEEYEVKVSESSVTYRSKSPRGEGSATVPFELVSRKTTPFTRANPFFRNAAIYFAVLAVITVAFGFLIDVSTTVSLLWAVLAGVLYLIYRITGVQFEIFPLVDGRVFRLIKDKPTRDEYSAFRRELFARRDAYLRSRYARIDVERPAPLERRRIEWLHDEGVLDEDAYVTIVETIEEHASRS
ncbi:MAG: hypothetical protein ACOC0E_01595 [Spirochaetota bacterium]